MDLGRYESETPLINPRKFPIRLDNSSLVFDKNEDIQDSFQSYIYQNLLIIVKGSNLYGFDCKDILDNPSLKASKSPIIEIPRSRTMPSTNLAVMYPYAAIATKAGLEIYKLDVEERPTVYNVEFNNDIDSLYIDPEDMKMVATVNTNRNIKNRMRSMSLESEGFVDMGIEGKYIKHGSFGVIIIDEGSIRLGNSTYRMPLFPEEVYQGFGDETYRILAAHPLACNRFLMMIWYLEYAEGTTALLFGTLGNEEFDSYAIQEIDIPVEGLEDANVFIQDDALGNVYIGSNKGPEIYTYSFNRSFSNDGGEKWTKLETEDFGVDGYVESLFTFPYSPTSLSEIWAASRGYIYTFSLSPDHFPSVRQEMGLIENIIPQIVQEDIKDPKTTNKGGYEDIIKELEALVEESFMTYHEEVDALFHKSVSVSMEALNTRSSIVRKQVESMAAEMNNKKGGAENWNIFANREMEDSAWTMKNRLNKVKDALKSVVLSEEAHIDPSSDSAKLAVTASEKMASLKHMHGLLSPFKGKSLDFEYCNKKLVTSLTRTLSAYTHADPSKHSLPFCTSTLQQQVATPICITDSGGQCEMIVRSDLRILRGVLESLAW